MKFNVVKICASLIVILALLMCSSVATETTWRHSGFELWGYDINFTDHNASNIYLLDADYLHGDCSNVSNLNASNISSGEIPLAQIPNTLTGKDADTLDTKHYSDISSEIDGDVSTHAALSQNTHGAGAAETLLNTGDKDTVSGIPSLSSSKEINPHNFKKGVSDNLRNSHDTERTHGSSSWNQQSIITFTNGYIGNARVKFDLRTSFAGYDGFGKIYKNGIPLGTEQVEPSASYNTKSEDLALNMNAGDTLELWIRSEGGGVNIYVRNFRLYYDNDPTIAVVVTTSHP